MSAQHTNAPRGEASTEEPHGLYGFILPDTKLSLKLVFDNLRNYAICGALLLGWIYVQGPEFDGTRDLFTVVGFTGVIAAFSLLNVVQTIHLAALGYKQFAANSRKHSRNQTLLGRLETSVNLLLFGIVAFSLATFTIFAGATLTLRQANDLLTGKAEDCAKPRSGEHQIGGSRSQSGLG